MVPRRVAVEEAVCIARRSAVSVSAAGSSSPVGPARQAGRLRELAARVFTTATFIGYLLAGWMGAAVATVGIFLPAFVLVGASGPFLSLFRESRLVASILDGVTIGALALMAVVTWQLGRAAVVDVVTAGLAIGSAVLLLRFRLNSSWVIVAGAAVGTILGIVRAR